jgi:hypothetical protein
MAKQSRSDGPAAHESRHAGEKITHETIRCTIADPLRHISATTHIATPAPRSDRQTATRPAQSTAIRLGQSIVQEVPPMPKRLQLALAALALTGLLGGCVAYPAYPAYGYGYGYPGPYAGGTYVAVGGGWHGGGWHGGGWHH